MKKFLSLMMMTSLAALAWAQTWVATPVSELATGDVVVIAETSALHAMGNTGGTSSAPSAVAITLNGDKTQITSTVDEDIQWTVEKFSGTADTLQFKAGDNYLYSIDTNNGLRVGSSQTNKFVIKDDYLYNLSHGRYVGVYNNANWRSYTSINNNIKDQTFAFFKLTVVQSNVATPVITLNPAEGPYYEGDEVVATITCETEGATVYYKIDDGDWTEGCSVRVSQSCRIFAKAILGKEESNVSNVKVEFIKSLYTIAEFNALDDNTDFMFRNPVTVLGTYTSGNNKGVYVQDNTAGMLIFGANLPDYKFGDVIPGGFGGTRSTYRGAPQMVNPENFSASTDTDTPVAIEVGISEVNVDNYGRYAVIKGVTIDGSNLVLGTESVTLFNRFGVDQPTDIEGKTYDVYGVISYYNGNQFLPLEYKLSEQTGITDITVSEGNVRYVSPMGVVSDRPFSGLNIVIDGQKVYKIVK